MSHRYPCIKSRALSASNAVVLCLILSGFHVLPVHARDNSGTTLEEVTVTGSRIVRRDFQANSPITTVDKEMFENTSTAGIENVLNHLPQFIPAGTQFNTQDVQQTAANTLGVSSISLRGLGPNRNLVLLDGRRAIPVNAGMAIDINTIPGSAIARVESISGGASATYGGDAMAGVTNFILKNDYEGAEINTQYNTTEVGDAQELRISTLLGASVSEGRGNVMFGGEYFDRKDARRIDRDYAVKALADPTNDGTNLFYSDTAYAPDPFNRPSQAATDAIFSALPPGTLRQTPFDNSGNFFINTDGTVYTGGSDFGGNTGAAGAYRYSGPFLVNGVAYRKITDDGGIHQNSLDSLISIPLKRYSMFGRGHFGITENLSVFGQGTFANTSTRTLQTFFAPASGAWAASIPHGTGIYVPSVGVGGATPAAYQSGGTFGLNCPSVGGCTNSQVFPTPPELTALLDSRGNPNATWQLNKGLDFLGPARTANQSTTYQVIAGFEGKFPSLDWTWEAYASHGGTIGHTNFLGFGSLARWRAVVTAPNYGKSFFVSGGFGGGLGRCDTGIPVFGIFTPSDDCIDAVQADLQNTQKMEQTIFEANVQGHAFDLPPGEVRFATGASYRRNTYQFHTDHLSSQSSFLDSGIGLFPLSNSTGKTDVGELYMETLVPVLKDLPLVKSFGLELGYRYSDYDSVGSVDTYKALFDWSVDENIRFRGGYQVANRAPNIAELFEARTQTVGISFLGDFCSTANVFAPYSANPTVNPNAAAVRAVCEARMGGTGSSGATTYYSGSQTTGGFTFMLSNRIGNPDVDIESARTITVGAVVTSPWEHPLLNRMSLTADWYQIKISDLISTQSADDVYTACLNPASNPAFDPNAPACLLIQRDPNSGNIAPTDVTYTNGASVKYSGVDLQFNWGTDTSDLFGLDRLLPGSLNLNFMTTILLTVETQAPNAAKFDWVGTGGPILPSLNFGSYDYRTFTTLTWANGPMNVGLNWRFLPALESVNAVTAAPGTNAVVPSGDYHIFDLHGSYTFGGHYTLRAGIENLLGTDPEILNKVVCSTAPKVAPSCDDATGTPGGFGFYDALGRRFFVGIKAEY